MTIVDLRGAVFFGESIRCRCWNPEIVIRWDHDHNEWLSKIGRYGQWSSEMGMLLAPEYLMRDDWEVAE